MRATSESRAAPPSALPGISPTRREIRKRHHRCVICNSRRKTGAVGERRPGGRRRPISPLVGEMPGRAEGGIDTRLAMPIPIQHLND
ncbi:hypothetical protein AOX55_00006366 (plasmid) [Sinorhizobium fredii CCBAU 25509]|nr:hypothetical protein AOX55_00006366 [Sinorhizobium fredii CCBAU 25509]